MSLWLLIAIIGAAVVVVGDQAEKVNWPA